MPTLTVRAWMESQGIGQEELARQLDKSFVSVNRWLNGKRDWPFDVVLEIKRKAKESGHELTDESFLTPAAERAKTRRRRSRAA